jgi:hypothetical protein
METDLQNTIDYAINTQDSPSAIRVLVMFKKNPDLNSDPHIAWQLRYVRMNSLTVEQLLKLMSESILTAYAIPDFDLDFRLKDYLEQIDNVAEEIKFYNGLLKVLDVSEEVLGKDNITLKGIAVKPTIGNWLDDFSSFPTGDHQKDALAEIEYLNKSSNIKTLTEPDRNILKNIIKMFDHAVQAIALYNSVEVPKSEHELYKDYDLYKLIPGLEGEEAESVTGNEDATESQSDIAPQPQEVPAPQSTVPEQSAPIPSPAPPTPIIPTSTPEQRRTVEGIKKTQAKPVDYGSANKPSPNLSAADSAKIRDLINHKPPTNVNDKRGVTMDPTNVKIDDEAKRLNQERAQQAAAIQKKLADLRQRNSK